MARDLEVLTSIADLSAGGMTPDASDLLTHLGALGVTVSPAEFSNLMAELSADGLVTFYTASGGHIMLIQLTNAGHQYLTRR